MSSFDATGVLRVLSESPFHELVSRFTAFAVMVTDAEGRVVWVNSSFEKLSGWPVNDVSAVLLWSFCTGLIRIQTPPA